ncbi:MAG: PQQ-binding-like beta-propeller repeat protein [Candidatus Thermoplasmatota archaeon]|jgi:outer membrane protein assembly factor BamB|nr:PQQ-binding-like beta-propeller repeat protein [Candidatus Thermoplasmatota archaeon]
MKIDRVNKKSIIAWIILLLVLNLTFSTNVSSDPVKYDYDGIWYDMFVDQNGIDTSESYNYNFSPGLITLRSGTNKYYYDFNDNKTNAWTSDLTFISGEENQLIRPRNLVGEISLESEYNKIKKKDDVVVRTEGRYLDLETFNITRTFSPVHHFRFKIGQNKNNINEFTFNWFYGSKITDANVASVKLYVWNYLIKNIVGLWTQEGSPVYYDYADPISISFTSNNTKFVSDDGYIDFLVVAIPKVNGETTILTTDYVNLTVTTKYGFVEKGWIISREIKPDTLKGWESIVWKGLRTSNDASIKIHVLDSKKNVITSLPGNSKGFTTSQIDLSSLSATSYKSIRLKAVLESSDLSVTPKLYSWALTWQTESNTFKDKFSTDVRIDELLGAEIIGGDIKISDSSSDWPVFGRTPQNRRSYEGYGPQKSELYWSTKKKTVGGGFRSPVLSDGKIYIASPVNNTICSFNATVPLSKKGSQLSPYDRSDPLYKVDGSVAVANNFVIVATSEINASNKVVALNKSNLKQEKWSYTFGDGNICYSSSPTVSGDKVFVTSWDGMPLTTPLISFLSSLIGGNNKVIALNIADGTKIWDYTLPAGSFSTPAIGNGMVFVGCDNIYGDNLFAFDEETGALIWKVKVGLIGGASPAVYQNKVFVVVKEIKLPYVTGDVKVVALDQQTGKILWNKTLAEKVPAFENLPKGLKFYNLMATSTPAVDGGILYVTSPDGKIYALNTVDGVEKWNASLSSNLFGVVPTYSCTSPVVTSDNLYVATINGMVYSLNKNNGKTLWNYNCDIKDPELLALTYILASPIVANGVLYVSVTDEINTFSGRICSIGNYTTYQKAVVISNPIFLPAGRWWSSFKASFTNTTSSSITFSILDDDYNFLRSVKNNDDISSSDYIKKSIIRLRAELTRKDKSQNPALQEWSVTWSSETTPPDFEEETFIPGGWINTNTPTCIIKVIDTYPGLSVSSARYQIEYTSKANKTVTSPWFIPECSGTDGTKVKQSLTANISKLNISDMAELKSIRFYIKDLAGNNASFFKNFQKDTVPPSSKINGSFSSKYNRAVNITVNATDDKSDIKNVTLYYRISGDTYWTIYDKPLSTTPYTWLFNVTKSGNYEFCSGATDNAGNIENYQTKKIEATFTFDRNKPYKPVFNKDPAFNKDGYYFNEPRNFSIKFEDDYKLKSVEYRLNFQGLNEWTMIKDNIDLPSYSGEWNLTGTLWDSLNETVTYYIYFRLTDFCGNVYTTPDNSEAAKIIKDLTVSKPYLDLSDFSEWHWDDEFNISATINDIDIKSVELYYRYSADNKNWGEWTLVGKKLTEKPFNWKFNAKDGSGYYQFKTRISDFAGNIGESPLETIGVTLFPMTQIIIMIILAFILIIIIVLMLTKMRKKKT